LGLPAACWRCCFYLLQPILLPFVLGGLIAYFGDPLVDRVEARGGSRTLGVVLVFLVFTLLYVFAPCCLPCLCWYSSLMDRSDACRRLYAWLRDVSLPWLQSRTMTVGGHPAGDRLVCGACGELASLSRITAKTIGSITGSGLGSAPMAWRTPHWCR
jgi:hypothetical protein